MKTNQPDSRKHKHSKLPWRSASRDGKRYALYSGEKLIAGTRRNTEFVLRAANNFYTLLEACKVQHEAIDYLLAMLVVEKPDFRPSKSGLPWSAAIQGNQAIKAAEGEES